MTALQEIADMLMAPVREQLADLKVQLVAQRERADRAEQRTREAETRAAEFQQQLQTEMIEHRRVVGLLAEQLAARHSWWPWRR